MFPTVTMCTQLRTLRTGSYAPDLISVPIDRDMTLAKDNTPCHADRSRQVILVTSNVEHSNDLYKVWT